MWAETWPNIDSDIQKILQQEYIYYLENKKQGVSSIFKKT